MRFYFPVCWLFAGPFTMHGRHELLKGNVYVGIIFFQENHPASYMFVLSFVFQAGKRVGKLLHSSLQTVLDEEEKLGTTRKKVGFLG